MYPHRIRLRGPWEWETVDPLEKATPRRVTMPCRWADLDLGGSPGPVRFHRRFGLPRRLDAHERVWLRITGAAQGAGVWLNERGVGRGNVEVDVTAHLEARNHLQVETGVPDHEGSPWDEIVLEIRCTAFLHEVRTWTEREGEALRLHAAGVVAGTADGPLEVYVLAENRTVGYATVTPGEAFTVVTDPLPKPPEGVRVELVCGAVVWYAVEPSVV